MILLTTAREGRIIDVNETALRTLEHGREEIIGRTTEEIGMWEDLSDRSTVLRMLEEQGSVRNVEVRWKGKTGKALVGLYSGEMIQLDGESCILGSVRDITERKKAEEGLVRAKEEWELTFDAVPDLIAVFDERHRIVRVNRAMAERLGRRSEEFMGLPCHEVVHQADAPAGYCPHVATLSDGREHHVEVHEPVLRGDFLVSTTPLIGTDGKMHGVVHVARDITEQKMAATEIKRLNAALASRAAELETANKELEAFNYTVAHDLRKPLTVINGYCQVMLELCGGRLDDECREYLQKANDGTWQMNRLIDSLLLFSQAANAEPKREPVDLSRTAGDVAEELRLAEPWRNVVFRIAPGLMAEGDANLLRAVLANLMGNAWKYTRDREEAIIEFGAVPDRQSTFFVRDNGIGFDPSEAGELFIPFRRLAGGQRVGGLGIGLATVERIIRRHGGRVWAEGRPGKGATLYFTLGWGR